MKESGIYCIANVINGKRYIGSAIDMNNRWSKHKMDLRKKKHCNVYLQRAWNKYSCDNFSFSVLEYCSLSDLVRREQYYLDELKPEYNIARKAKSLLGFRHTKETKEKCRDAARGNRGFAGHHREKSPEERAKISAALKGRKFSKEHCENIAKSKTDEAKEKLAQANKDRVWTPEARERSRASHKGRHGNRLSNGQFAKGGGFTE